MANENVGKIEGAAPAQNPVQATYAKMLEDQKKLLETKHRAEEGNVCQKMLRGVTEFLGPLALPLALTPPGIALLGGAFAEGIATKIATMPHESALKKDQKELMYQQQMGMLTNAQQQGQGFNANVMNPAVQPGGGVSPYPQVGVPQVGMPQVGMPNIGIPQVGMPNMGIGGMNPYIANALKELQTTNQLMAQTGGRFPDNPLMVGLGMNKPMSSSLPPFVRG